VEEEKEKRASARLRWAGSFLHCSL